MGILLGTKKERLITLFYFLDALPIRSKTKVCEVHNGIGFPLWLRFYNSIGCPLGRASVIDARCLLQSLVCGKDALELDVASVVLIGMVDQCQPSEGFLDQSLVVLGKPQEF